MTALARRVWLGLGSNLGDRRAQLRAALDALEGGGVALEAVSSLYETPPWGVTDQPPFANAAVEGRSDLEAHALLALCKRIEVAAGRDFAAPRWSARSLDIDVLLLEEEQIAAPALIVPHPLMHERAFVLVPLAEIAAKVVVPGLDVAVAALLDALPSVEREAVVVLEPRGWHSAER